MELRHLRYFVAVAEELNFSRAAERLFMAQPPLSQQIRQLETEIGVALFNRTNRKVDLTPAGKVFLEESRRILSGADVAVKKAQRVARGEAGWFGVGFVSSAAYDVMPVILRRFRETYPSVELALQEIPSAEQWDALREMRIDVGFVHLPEVEPDITSETLSVNSVMVALPAAHSLASNERIGIAELENEPFVLTPDQPGAAFAEYVVRLCRTAGFEPRVVQKTGEMPTAISLVDAGIGVAVVPASVQNLRRDGVVYRPISPSSSIPLAIGYRVDDSSPVLGRFLEIARAIVKAGAASDQER